MVRSLMAGGTNFANQSLADIIAELEVWSRTAERDATKIRKSAEHLAQHEYWQTRLFDVRSLTVEIVQLLSTVNVEAAAIASELRRQVTQSHIRRLNTLYRSADEFEERIRIAKNDMPVERAPYELLHPLLDHIADCRDSLAGLFDLDNVRHRLEDFVGMNDGQTNNPFQGATFQGTTQVNFAQHGASITATQTVQQSEADLLRALGEFLEQVRLTPGVPEADVHELEAIVEEARTETGKPTPSRTLLEKIQQFFTSSTIVVGLLEKVPALVERVQNIAGKAGTLLSLLPPG